MDGFARVLTLLSAVLAVALPDPAGAQPQTDFGVWPHLRAQYYQDREIAIGPDAVLQLLTPDNTPDAAATPLSIRLGPEGLGQVAALRLIIDNNPAPMAALFRLPAGSRLDGIETRVRIDRFTTVRVIAETHDGRLLMRSRQVQAAGGCAAPPGASEAGRLGEIRLRSSPDARALAIGIRHPNASGFQIDPLTGEPIPAYYVSQLRLLQGLEVLLDAELGISISENPGLRLSASVPFVAPLTVEAQDSEAGRYRNIWQDDSGGV